MSWTQMKYVALEGFDRDKSRGLGKDTWGMLSSRGKGKVVPEI